jgi:hypothetical protein
VGSSCYIIRPYGNASAPAPLEGLRGGAERDGLHLLDEVADEVTDEHVLERVRRQAARLGRQLPVSLGAAE